MNGTKIVIHSLTICEDLPVLPVKPFSMVKKFSYLLILFFSYISFVSLTTPPSLKQKPQLRTIIIDAGHGGKDPGAHGLFSHESEVALAISLKLGQAIS